MLFSFLFLFFFFGDCAFELEFALELLGPRRDPNFLFVGLTKLEPELVELELRRDFRGGLRESLLLVLLRRFRLDDDDAYGERERDRDRERLTRFEPRLPNLEPKLCDSPFFDDAFDDGDNDDPADLFWKLANWPGTPWFGCFGITTLFRSL